MSENENKSWIATVLDSISSGFTKIIESVRKHGIMVAMFTIVVITLLWSIILNPIKIGDMIQEQWHLSMKKQQEQKNDETEISIQRREEANFFVSELMIDVLEKFSGVNRVLLLEKHNGNSNLNGIDFLYSSCTYELINDNIQNPNYLYEDLQKQTNLNLLGNLVQTLKHKDYIYISDLSKNANQKRLLRKLSNAGDKEAMIFSFRDSKNRPIIILVISGNNLDVKSIEEYINLNKKQIDKLLVQ